MKRLFVVLAVVAMVFSVAVSSAEEKKSVIGVDIETEFYSQYVNDLGGIRFIKDPTLKQSVIATHNSSGVYLMGSVLYDLKRKFNGSDDFGWGEYFVGKEGKIDNFHYDVYFAAYDTFQLGKVNSGDLYGAGFRLDYEKNQLYPFVAAEYIATKGDSGQNGALWRFGIKPEFKKVGIELSLGGHDTIYGGRTAILSSGRVGFSYEIEVTKNIKVIPQVSFQKSFEHKVRDGGLTEDLIWGAVKITYKF